jgi:hypothetical protein
MADPVKSEKTRSPSPGSDPAVEQREHASRLSDGDVGYSSGPDGSGDKARQNASQKLANPLAGLSTDRLGAMGEEYAQKNGMTDEEDVRAFRLGAIIAGNMNKFDTVEGLNEHELDVLRREDTHKWSNPKMLYAVIAGMQLD